MATEIERKFLVIGDGWRMASPTYVCQGYLNRDQHRTVRVRIIGNTAYLTVKGLTTGSVRAEFEYPIPLDDARQLLQLCERPLIEKHRHIIPHHGATWEVDEFLGDNLGLVVAEIELASEGQQVDVPGWVGKEVTDDPRYFNSNLSRHPYTQWTRASGT